VEFRKANGGQWSSAMKPRLRRWVVNIRRSHQSENLEPSRLESLRAAGFDFESPIPQRQGPPRRSDNYQASGKGSIWQQRLAELREFRTQHGHFRPHPHKPSTSRLYMWMAAQRRYRKQGKLANTKINALDEIGFPWEAAVRSGVITPKWMLRLEQAQAFLSSKGHLQIPKNYAPNRQLGSWAVEQRRMRRKGKLSAEQIRLLDELGFVWSQETNS
jgi:hypothetical protein